MTTEYRKSLSITSIPSVNAHRRVTRSCSKTSQRRYVCWLIDFLVKMRTLQFFTRISTNRFYELSVTHKQIPCPSASIVRNSIPNKLGLSRGTPALTPEPRDFFLPILHRLQIVLRRTIPTTRLTQIILVPILAHFPHLDYRPKHVSPLVIAHHRRPVPHFQLAPRSFSL